MAQDSAPKLLARNVAAFRVGQDPASATRIASGNPVSTRLESGVGNCYPGLECDVRNLERRFFPFLEVDLSLFQDPAVPPLEVISVDLGGVADAAAAGNLTAADEQSYRTIAEDLRQGAAWFADRMAGDFGPLGQQDIV